MNDELRKEIIREELKRRHKGKKVISARYKMRFPESAEREYVRLARNYMAAEKEILIKYLPELKRLLTEGTIYNMDSKKDNEKKRKRTRLSRMARTAFEIDALFDNIEKELENAYAAYKLRDEINKIANLGYRLTVEEWKKTVNKTLGINLLDDYYSGDYYKEMLEQWVSDNVDLIKTVPKESLGKMKEKIYTDYMSGRSTSDIAKELQLQYGMDKRHAKMVARDQIAKLNSKITQSQQRDAGIEKYKWSAVMDQRTRDSHAELNGKIFSWDDPPETDGGRRCHPGEDYQCRCVAIPVFDIDKLDLPV